MSEIANEATKGENDCPSIAALTKEPKCLRDVQERQARKAHEAEVKYLAEAQVAWAASIDQMRQCELKREKVVADAKAADVKGANVKLVLRPLVQAWEILPAQAAEQWTGICTDAQRFLQSQ
jgi:hypothetical protein